MALGGQSIPNIHTCSPPSDFDVVAIEVSDVCSPCVYMSFSDITDKTYFCISQCNRERLNLNNHMYNV